MSWLQKRKRRLFSIAKIVLVSAGGILILASISLFAVASMNVFLPLRQELTAQVLSSVLVRDAEVRGDVDLELGNIVSVRIEEAYIESGPASPDQAPRGFESVSFDAGLGVLSGNVNAVSNFRMYGADIEFEVGSGEGTDQLASMTDIPSAVLNSPVLANISLADVVLRFVDSRDGWNETIEIDRMKLATARNLERTYAVLDGKLNGTPFEVIGEVVRVNDGNTATQGRFDFGFDVPGLSARAQGTIDTTRTVADVAGRVSAVSPSLSRLLSSLSLAGDIDGTAELDWSYQGPLDSLRFFDILAVIETELGDQLTVSGSIGNSEPMPEVDLDFSASLAPPKDTGDALIAIEIEEITGHLSGPLDALSISRARVKTDKLLVTSNEIGPISVGRIVKHPNNRVGLEEIVIEEGPEDSPYLVFEGQIQDVIGMRGGEFDGTFSIPTSLLIDETMPDIPGLGLLTGSVRLGEASGAFGIENFQAVSAETDLFDLSLDLVVPEFRVLSELDFQSEISVPDPQLLLSAFDIDTEKQLPATALSGSLKMRPQAVSVTGLLSAGASSIQTDISLAPVQGSQTLELSGSVTSPRLDLSDLAGYLEFREIETGDIQSNITVTEDFDPPLRADVTFAVDELLSGKKKAGNVSGSILYEGSRLELAGLRLDYLGGTIRGDFAVDAAREPASAKASGRMEKFPLKRLMNEFGLRSPISSSVYASFDILANLGSETEILRSLSGRLTASLWGGTLPDRVVELAGLSAFTWLVTGNQENTAKLLCAVLPLHFKKGVASTGALIVETENVQIAGKGVMNFRSGALALSFVPRAKRKQLVEIVSPFDIKGTMTSPELVIKEGGAGRVIGEIASLPLNLIGHIFRGSGQIDENARPCVLPRNSGPK